MILRNRERHAVTLAPACSSLLSTAGDRIEHGAVAFEPCEATLDTDQQREIRIVVTIPAGAKRDRYAGLIVVNGAADLCAVIVLDVT